ncbi:MAG: beta-phosphoglucomutase [Oscillospiraceae bacterium]|nr:beta-phosphoglucomutase [Oscillospiraceae bacterium]
MVKGAIFDLDGVLVDTAKYHYLAWKELALELGFDFTEKDNEQLKGVSRMRSLELLLQIGKISMTEAQKLELADRKNRRYVQMLQALTKADLLEGAEACILQLRQKGVKISLGSASKNAPFILEKLEIRDLFDAVVDGNMVSRAKPDPEVFLTAVQLLALKPEECCVFEDAQAGIDAAKAAGCLAIAVDKAGILMGADMTIHSLSQFQML